MVESINNMAVWISLLNDLINAKSGKFAPMKRVKTITIMTSDGFGVSVWK